MAWPPCHPPRDQDGLLGLESGLCKSGQTSGEQGLPTATGWQPQVPAVGGEVPHLPHRQRLHRLAGHSARTSFPAPEFPSQRPPCPEGRRQGAWALAFAHEPRESANGEGSATDTATPASSVQGDDAEDLEDLEGDETGAGVRLPAPSTGKHVLAGKSSGWIHSGAAWYYCFSCSMLPQGCPGRVMIMRMRDDPHHLRVVFKHDCVHSAVSLPHGQLRGAARNDLVETMSARTAARAHGLSMTERSTAA